METFQLLTSIIAPVSISVFLWIERRSIMNLIADFRLEKDTQGVEVSEAEILDRMERLLRGQNAGRP